MMLISHYKESAAEASKPNAISVPVIRNGVMVQERPSRTLKRKHSFDSSELQSAKSGPSVTTCRVIPCNFSSSLSLITNPFNAQFYQDQSNVTSTAKPSSPPNEIPCERCKTSGKSCVGPVGRPCVQCKKVKLGCSFSNPKNAPSKLSRRILVRGISYNLLQKHLYQHPLQLRPQQQNYRQHQPQRLRLSYIRL